MVCRIAPDDVSVNSGSVYSDCCARMTVEVSVAMLWPAPVSRLQCPRPPERDLQHCEPSKADSHDPAALHRDQDIGHSSLNYSQVTWNLTVSSSIETLSLVFLNFDINTVMNTEFAEMAI